ncbi:hypothetical protein BH11PLA1_BH11PLA1_08870 [soil metagenome]
MNDKREYGSGDAGSAPGVERVLRVARRVLGDVRALDALARDQSAAVSAGELEIALSIIAQREAVVVRVVQGHEELEPVVAAQAHGAAEIDEGDARAGARRDVQMMLAEIDETLMEIARRDASDQRAMLALRTRVGEQLAAAVTGRGVIGAYGGTGTGGALFQDRQG